MNATTNWLAYDAEAMVRGDKDYLWHHIKPHKVFQSGEQMISFKPGGFLHMSAVVNIQPNAARLQELPLLVILGWYLAILLHNDSSAAAAAAAA